LSSEDIEEIYKKTFFADTFFVSSNAITEDGTLYNVDGRGNRVAAMTYGPRKVIVIAGVNKIVKDLDDAIRRVEETAAPANTRRLDLSTPCKTLGYCTDCQSDDRICNKYSVLKKAFDENRFHIILLNDTLGF
jgi:L-lactate utilization protein LutB